MAQISEKDSYSELTEKQQAVVDEYVQDPTAQNTELAERADVSRATVYNVKEHYGDILESRLNQHGRNPGKETTEGDPYTMLENEIAPQWIGDRPHQPEASNGGESTLEEATDKTHDEPDQKAVVSVELDRLGVRDVLENQECAHVRAAVVDALITQAFAQSE